MFDYRYAEELTALHEMLQNKGVQTVLKLFENMYSAATEFAELRGRNYKVTPVTEPRLHYLYRRAAKRLEMTADVPVYLELSDQLVPRIIGTDGKCAIVVSSACLDRLTNLEWTALFGNALSHIKYGHVKYLNLGKVLDELLIYVPFVGGPAAIMIKALFLQWNQYVEFTADRGAAIAAGDARAVFSYLSQCMGASFVVWHDQKEARYSVKKMLKAERLAFQILVEDIPVPFGNLRLEEIRRWLCSDVCRRHFPPLFYGGMGERTARSRCGGRNAEGMGERLYRSAADLFHSDHERAMLLLYAAVSCNYAKAQDYLARCYINGAFGVEKNDLVGLDLLKRAARQQCRESLFTLGQLMLTGTEIIMPKNEQMGCRLIRLSAEKGCPQALEWLEKHKGDGIH